MSHVVSEPVAESPATLSVPAAHATHALDSTFSFSAHNTVEHALFSHIIPAEQTHSVSSPEAKSPAVFVLSTGHATHAFDETRSFVEHDTSTHVAWVLSCAFE